MWFFKAALILVFIYIFMQDYKDRMVYWFLYPILGLLSFIVQLYYNAVVLTLTNTAVNLLLISIVIIVIYFYSRIVMKQRFSNESIGTGDLMLLIFLTFTFSTISFIILFVFSLIFSVVLHVYLKNKSVDKTVPLAGYISIFFAAVYFISFFTAPKYLFAY